MEKEDDLRTVECLRGRLIAERSASRKAKEDVELMGKKLIELEKKLKEENKSRNKAEKKLKYLMKKLESMNISYVSDESEHSSLFDKSEISSVTFSEDKEQSYQFQDSIGSTKCSSEYLLEHSQEHISQENKDDDNNSKGGEVLGKSSELDFSNSDSNSSKISVQEEEGKNGEDERDFQEDNVNNSLALVPIDLPKPKETIDPIILDATVREVLDALRHAKEKLQTRMERGCTIKVG
ncbi:hypothetical protein CQW23_24479 [Capsicum baccatum]|uniref:Uncharacterized protein n=1 Tax=Capsicum baccatum TaxID=33114 RepID=A0A2G2VUV6_CAPBA|nr:hypothetical protein CQW23_24479 [Capsicum baccatum]